MDGPHAGRDDDENDHRCDHGYDHGYDHGCDHAIDHPLQHGDGDFLEPIQPHPQNLKLVLDICKVDNSYLCPHQLHQLLYHKKSLPLLDDR